jgi:hypothetical protein
MPARSEFQVRLFGVDELEQLARTLVGVRGRLARELAQGLADALAEASPDDGGHRLADSWKGRALSDELAVVESHHPGAKARDRGAYLVGRRGQPIRFRSAGGDLVFARFVRQKPEHYTRRALAKRRVIAEAVFDREVAELKAAG